MSISWFMLPLLLLLPKWTFHLGRLDNPVRATTTIEDEISLVPVGVVHWRGILPPGR